MNDHYQRFMDDLSALVSKQPTTDDECIAWLQALVFNAVETIEYIERDKDGKPIH